MTVQPMTCRRCRCTNDAACEGGCHWVKPGLCSQCAETELGELVDAVLAWRESRLLYEFEDEARLGGFPCSVEVEGQSIAIRDHLGVFVCSIDEDGARLAPQYDAREVMRLFEKVAA